MAEFVILGCGYTGRRVARRLVQHGYKVTATVRNPAAAGLDGVEVRVLDVLDVSSGPVELNLPEGARVLYSIPVVRPDSEWMRRALAGCARVVYLSTTGVYGDQETVDHTTLPKPRTENGRRRLEEEHAVASGPWQALILRPAAIYGPDRGVHMAMREGRHRVWGDGRNYISRIHADDLAAIAEAALLAGITGAYPVADDAPCTAREITEYCAALLGIAPARDWGDPAASDTRRVNRRVDGRRIRELLSVELRYPSYREGIRAALK